MPDFLLAYFLTLVLESPFIIFFVPEKSLREKITAILLVNATTLPLLWAFLPVFFASYFPAFLAMEFLVFCAESILFAFALGIPLKKSVLLSFTANFVSAAIGFALF